MHFMLNPTSKLQYTVNRGGIPTRCILCQNQQVSYIKEEGFPLNAFYVKPNKYDEKKRRDSHSTHFMLTLTSKLKTRAGIPTQCIVYKTQQVSYREEAGFPLNAFYVKPNK
jgi:hypothetical protein